MNLDLELYLQQLFDRPYSHRDVDIVDDEDRSVGTGETGELAKRDEHGNITLVGRKRDMIRRGGENIAAVEVATVLQQHLAVELAACVSVPDPQ